MCKGTLLHTSLCFSIDCWDTQAIETTVYNEEEVTIFESMNVTSFKGEFGKSCSYPCVGMCQWLNLDFVSKRTKSLSGNCMDSLKCLGRPCI